MNPASQCRDEKCWHGHHASPVFTTAEDRTVTMDWPDDMPDHCIVSKPLIVEWMETHNELVRLKADLNRAGQNAAPGAVGES